MTYYIRLMSEKDIDQVTEIDQEAFPTMWPPANYERELRTSLAHYIIAYESDNPASGKKKAEAPIPNNQRIIGFAGLWMIGDEAHITNIAVRKSHRQRGIGELMFISMIDLAAELKANIVTLEVRVSNTPAQSLYLKYGFVAVARQYDYYRDNNEDAILMSLNNINSVPSQQRFNQLKKAHSEKWGITDYFIDH